MERCGARRGMSGDSEFVSSALSRRVHGFESLSFVSESGRPM